MIICDWQYNTAVISSKMDAICSHNKLTITLDSKQVMLIVSNAILSCYKLAGHLQKFLVVKKVLVVEKFLVAKTRTRTMPLD